MENNTGNVTTDLYDISQTTKSTWVHFLIFGCSLVGILWGVFNVWIVSFSKLIRSNFYNHKKEIAVVI